MDLIDRQAVLDALRARFGVDFDWGKWWNSTHVLAAIESLPSVTPQPKVGHWIDCDDSDDYSADGYDCSVCGCNAEYATDYCPECGAKMVRPWESEG